MEPKVSAKEKICTTMLELMKKDSFKDITVKQLIAEAGLNRSSFYYHFNTISDVVDYIIRTFVDGYFQSMKPSFDVSDSVLITDFHLDCWERAVAYLYNQKDTVITLTKPEYTPILFQYLKKHQLEAIQSMELFYSPIDSPDIKKLSQGLFMDYFIYKSANDLIGILNYLVYRHFPDTPQNVAQMFYNMFHMQIVDFKKHTNFNDIF